MRQAIISFHSNLSNFSNHHISKIAPKNILLDLKVFIGTCITFFKNISPFEIFTYYVSYSCTYLVHFELYFTKITANELKVQEKSNANVEWVIARFKVFRSFSKIFKNAASLLKTISDQLRQNMTTYAKVIVHRTTLRYFVHTLINFLFN